MLPQIRERNRRAAVLKVCRAVVYFTLLLCFDHCRIYCSQAIFCLPDLPAPYGRDNQGVEGRDTALFSSVSFLSSGEKRSSAQQDKKHARRRSQLLVSLHAPTDGLVSFVCGSHCNRETFIFLPVLLAWLLFSRRQKYGRKCLTYEKTLQYNVKS